MACFGLSTFDKRSKKTVSPSLSWDTHMIEKPVTAADLGAVGAMGSDYERKR